MTYTLKGKTVRVIAAGGHGKLGTKQGDYVSPSRCPKGVRTSETFSSLLRNYSYQMKATPEQARRLQQGKNDLFSRMACRVALFLAFANFPACISSFNNQYATFRDDSITRPAGTIWLAMWNHPPLVRF